MIKSGITAALWGVASRTCSILLAAFLCNILCENKDK